MDDCNRAKCRILMFPLPLQGHISPMIQLANTLHSKGFTISVIHTRYNFPDPSKHPNFTFHQISDGLPETETETLAASLAADTIAFIKSITANCQESFQHCLAQLLSDDTDRRIKCIITDGVWYFTQDAADRFNLSRIVLRTSSVCSYLAFSAFPLLRKQGYFPDMDSDMEAAIPELPPLKVKDIPIIKTQNPEDLYEIVHNMVEATKRATGLIFHTFKELEEPELARVYDQYPKPIFTIGPFHKQFSAASTSLLAQDRSSLSWLDTQAPRSVLYVSFGSIAAMDRQNISELAWGLADSMQPFLWVVRPGLVHGSEEWLEILPEEFLEATSQRGHIVKWAPQQEVLSHPAVGGFWTHNGWNSTLESICEGVPMISLPFSGDQMVNSRFVSNIWRIGIRLEKGIARGEIEDAIKRLMVDREGGEMRQRVVSLKEKADGCLNIGGSSYQELDGLINLISSLKSYA